MRKDIMWLRMIVVRLPVLHSRVSTARILEYEYESPVEGLFVDVLLHELVGHL